MSKKKNLNWLIFSLPVIIAAIIIILYYWIIPIWVYDSFVKITEWLFKTPSFIFDILSSGKNVVKIFWIVVGLKVLAWLLFAALIASLFWVGWTIQNKKPPIDPNARLVGKEAHLRTMDYLEQIKQIGSTESVSAKQAVYALCEKLKNESEFGSGKEATIRCENEIADCLDEIENNLPALRNGETAEGAATAIAQACTRATSKLKMRIELKKR